MTGEYVDALARLAAVARDEQYDKPRLLISPADGAGIPPRVEGIVVVQHPSVPAGKAYVMPDDLLHEFGFASKEGETA